MSTDWAGRIFRQEDPSGARVILRYAAAAGPDEVVDLELNLWILSMNFKTGVVHISHTFDPDEAEVPLAPFLAGLRERLEAVGG